MDCVSTAEEEDPSYCERSAFSTAAMATDALAPSGTVRVIDTATAAATGGTGGRAGGRGGGDGGVHEHVTVTFSSDGAAAVPSLLAPSK